MNWIAHPLPQTPPGEPLRSPIGGAKHGTLEWCPWRSEFFYVAGDNGGKTGNPLQPHDNNNNFRNEVWALTSPTMEWQLRQPYCTGKPGNRPHRPDWAAFVPDESRRLMWFWPGMSDAPPGTGGTYCDASEFAPWLPRSDYAPRGVPALRQPILAYDPEKNDWIDPHIPLEKYVRGSIKSWGAVYDPQKDELVRITWANGNSPPLVAMHLSLKSKTWSYQLIDKANGYPASLAWSSVGSSRYFFDPKSRKVWMIDALGREGDKAERGRKSWLCSYHVDERRFRREAEITQTAGMHEWAAGKLQISVTLCGDPRLRKGWWVVNAWDQSRVAYGAGADADHSKYDWTDVWKVLEVNLDTLACTDITPKKVSYPSGGPTRPKPYFGDERRLALTSGAHGRTVGYDSDHRQLVVCAGFASLDLFTLKVG
jgi:hypothetical protein